ncbi:unnamed protein product [Nezara viridula]|uniref:Uncharacterized protein n=1 Tax=Nezara viridula TaxID=85310 RepID=A0A9P0HHK8_NEZVI|nr:unnamed protein product [Nezara viridula]
MSECEGVNIYASGDYLLDERQGYLCSTIERLRAHMISLKEKLQEEKTLLSELKAETQYLTRQRAEVSEDYHLGSYQSISQISLRPPNSKEHAGDIATAKKPPEEPRQNFDRVRYVQRLREIDNLCKEEMAKMNCVVEQMEPLKQIASDWMLETRLKEISGTSISKDVNPVMQGSAGQPYRTEPGFEPAAFAHTAFAGEVIVIPPEKSTPPIPVFMPEGKCDAPPDCSVLKPTPIIKTSKSRIELKSKKESQLELDCMLKPVPQKNAVAATDRKSQLTKVKKETQPKNSSSEASLASLEALKEKNITLIEAADNKDRKDNVSQLDKKAEEDWKSTGSGKTSKSAISLESIQRAFANHHKKRRKTIKGGSNDTDAAGILQKADQGREIMSLDRKKVDQKVQDKLLAYLHPSAKKIVKNWVMVGRERKLEGLARRKAERYKKCILNQDHNKDVELSLCEDDVINKFLYVEDGYVYTPLFISEPEDELSSNANSVSEN